MGVGPVAATHVGTVVGHAQAHRARPAVTQTEQTQTVAESVNAFSRNGIVKHHGEQASRSLGIAQPSGVTGCTGKCRVQHARHTGLCLHPLRQLARTGILGTVTQLQRRQATQHQFRIVARHAQTQPHVGHQQRVVQTFVARDHRTHQHVGTAAGVFGQGLHHHIGTQVKTAEGHPGPPSVVQHRYRGAALGFGRGTTGVVGLHLRHQRGYIGEFQGDGASRLQPHQPSLRCELRGQIVRAHRIVRPVAYAPMRQFHRRKSQVGAVGVVRDQHLITRTQKGHINQRNRGQPAGGQHAMVPTFQCSDALFQRKGGGRAVQAVGIGRFVLPAALAHRRHVREQHRGGLEHPHRHRVKLCRGTVRVMHQLGRQGGFSRHTRLLSVAGPGNALYAA